MSDTYPSTASAKPARVRPGGRTHRNTTAIHGAVLHLLETRGLEFTLQDVAEFAGVSRRTLHRRWPDRNAVIAEALDHYYRTFQVRTCGDLRADLQSYLQAFRDFSGTPIELAINSLAAAARDNAFARANSDIWQRQGDPLTEILHDAQRRGELAPSANLAMLQLQLICPIIIAASIIREPMTDGDIDALIDQTLTGVLGRRE